MKKSILFSFFVALLLGFTSLTQAVFTDVASNHPYYEAIEYLQQNNIAEGYEDGSFQPERKVNRAEALKIILLGSTVLVPEIQEQDIFPDVLYGSWYARFAAKAKNLNIVSGDSHTGMFRPGDTVNLAEILKILLKTNHIEVTAPDSNPYLDVPSDAWFAPYFDYARSTSLLPQGSAQKVEPATPVTRGLMAELMYQLQMKPQGYQEGEASYYGEKFHGKGTASGEVFDASDFTAAHRTLPFNTWLKVKNSENGKQVHVRVNDRGPYAGDNRIIDLSKAAFEAISPLSRGVIQVSITPVNGPPDPNKKPPLPEEANCPTDPNVRHYSENIFENLRLHAQLPNTYLANQVFFLEGTSNSTKPEVSAFLTDEEGNQFSFTAKTEEDNSFSVPLVFPGTGDYELGLLPGRSGSSVVQIITVLPGSCLLSAEDASLPAPSDLKLNIERGDFSIRWNNEAGYNATKVSFIQGSKQRDYLLRNKTELTPHYPHFEGWKAEEVQLEVRAAKLDDSSFLEPEQIEWSPPVKTSFMAGTHHLYIAQEDEVKILSLPNTLSVGQWLTFKVDPKVNLDEKGKIILPSGLVEEVLLVSPTHSPLKSDRGLSIFPASASDVRLRFKAKSQGLHFVEINNEQGIAAVNIPVYPSKVYPLIPNIVELSGLKPESIDSDLSSLQNEMLRMVNADRATHGLAPVSLNKALSQLAQSKSDDMAKRAYFGHWNPDGLTANDLRKNFAITQFVSENIARDVNLTLAQYGLMRSAAHRGNILNKEWKQAGFGFTQDGNNGSLFVQIFSDDPIDFANLPALRTGIISTLNKKRSSALSLEGNLNNLAQNWADKWVSERWCNIEQESCNPLTAPDESFTDFLREGGVSATLGAYYRGDSSFESAKQAIAENTGIQDSRWKEIGIGMIQDEFGIIQIFIAYSE